jgi:ribosomal-protein-alanine N-acetyltransferase
LPGRQPVDPRPLLPGDLDRVAAIERATFSDPWPRTAFEELLREPHVRAFAVDGDDRQLAGYALCTIAADEGEILNLAVHPAEQRRGLGRALLQAMLETLRREGAAAVYLEVRQSNAAAIRLYGAAGFRSVSVRRSYYSHPVEHAVTMALELAPDSARKR